MDFVFDDEHPDWFRHEVMLLEIRSNEVFYDKLTFIYLEMPKFIKPESELVTHFDKWMYLLKNLNKFPRYHLYYTTGANFSEDI